MKRVVITMVGLLIGAHLLTEAASISAKLWPSVMAEKVNLFYVDGFAMERWWYVKMTCDDLLLVVTYFVLARVAYRYSIKLFMIACVFSLYHLIDGYMFWYNYKQSHWLYWALMASVILSILLLIIPFKVSGKYKSMV